MPGADTQRQVCFCPPGQTRVGPWPFAGFRDRSDSLCSFGKEGSVPEPVSPLLGGRGEPKG